MITVNDIIDICDSLSSLEKLQEITEYGISQLLANHENPGMILLAMDLAARDIARIHSDLRSEVERLRTENHTNYEPINTPPPQTTC
jgi:hypothetical protein